MKITLDAALAVWILMMGALFVCSLFVELQAVSRCVYIVVLGVCVVCAALSVTRAISHKMCGRSED